MLLTPVMEKFILHWGEMGSRWGVNRSVAQIHALLYLSDRPLPAEEIAETLAIARSNVSNSLKELQAYRLIETVHLRGDRRDHFSAETDPWQIMLRIADERKRREIDPLLTMLHECAEEAQKGGSEDQVVRQRVIDMQTFISDLSAWYGEMNRLPRSKLKILVQLGSRISAFIRQ
ncbi:DNA-binding transcriptional regulator GbsR, MarR family [Fulvimarina manganoxydans]|uniref:HTH-type transcriptional regulator n=1 Tax=Fulvimarina manganoxydans TaxID=937218 RepID=A0A1W2A0E0_9HYPH|nr:MarR family transcriptional regulator [Fulvimarina manganoxydans]SMC53871.1 DNA-binding transcriptional regulator GbsR, MarR family [Fulvimarina manganoxydans]